MKAKEIIGEGLWGKALKGAAALTGYNVLTDPESDKFSGAGVGRALRKTGSQIMDFGREVYKGVADRQEVPAAAEPKAAGASPQPAGKPVAEPAAEPAAQSATEPAEPGADNYLQDVLRKSDERRQQWPRTNEAVKKKFAVTEADKLDPLTALQRGIYGQESGYGKAKTDSPNYAGATGPMQIMPKTFDWMKKKKIIPKDFDIKNPEHNKQAGNALIAHYYQKYQGDSAKVAAAYYAGPGAINKDGTINTHWRDKKNPKAPTVGQYISQVQARANLPVLATATTVAGISSTTPSADKATPSADKPADKPTPAADTKDQFQLAKRKPGLSPEQALKQSDEELEALRASHRISVQPPPEKPAAEPQSVVPKTPEPAAKTAPAYARAYPDQQVAAAQDTGAWDKFINTVTKGRVPPQDKERIQVPESELNHILRLAGRKNEI